MKWVFTIFAIFSLSCAHALTLKEQLKNGKIGDYVVTEQGNLYTVLFIRDLNDKSLILEEVCVPEPSIPKKITWKAWVEKEAPGHTSWNAYEVNLRTNDLVEAYSYAKGTFLYSKDPENFLSKLLALSLKPTPEDRRRRIGPTPLSDEVDRRAFWNPPVIVEGKPIPKPPLTAWRGVWPKDNTLISGCEVELYFGPTSPFPYWIDVKNAHYRVSIQTVDSGSQLISPMPPIPHRIGPSASGGALPQEFLGRSSWKGKNITIKLECPESSQKLNVFVLDMTADLPPISLKCSILREGEMAVLEISEKTLKACLQKGHRYRWIIVPENTTAILAESSEEFTW